ncbi:acyl-CoA synthetase [Streptomyces sp. NBC_01016]|uniref:acyl-CoA synthetase n=1 Tax=Streptomyces sp. NBC_01016 TaxID=2903720 RepID=UPI002251C667|nr:acyl-CoA synthetase [Streptomyces sp. NBC_01016]MCX4831755.1 acyl-CoA synthetase [Streptomyces sp. NBC_01016]
MYPGAHAQTDPQRPAVIMASTGEQLTYGELDERSVRLAHVFREAGLRRGDVVALLTDNSIHAYEVYWAAVRSGLYITLVNHHLSAPEIAYIVGDSGAAALVVSDALADLARDVAGLIPATVRVRLAYGGSVDGYEDYAVALAGASAEPPADQPRGADLLYSSGTTGRPKGIRPELPDRQVGEPGDTLVELLRLFYGFDKDSVYLSPAPVYHAAPLRYGASVHALGGTVVMMERFDPEDALRAIERYQITHSQWVPTHFIRLLRLPEKVRTAYDLSSHKIVVHAAAPCPPDVKRAMIDWWGPKLYEYYSATEGIGMTLITSEGWLTKPGSVGRPILGQPRICDDEGRVLAAGETGTVYFAREGDGTFEYLGDADKTKGAQHPEHTDWVTLGDVGHLDEDGYLFLTDRQTFMIISGGVNIYPQEIENILALHPDITDVAVIGVPDPEMGEAVKAVAQPAPGVTPGPDLEERLIAYVRERIAHYKAPRSVDFVDELPRTPTGKLVKGKLKARYAQPAERQGRA